MASQNKKNKLKNSRQCKSGLKAKGKGIKGMTFYTSSERHERNWFKSALNHDQPKF